MPLVNSWLEVAMFILVLVTTAAVLYGVYMFVLHLHRASLMVDGVHALVKAARGKEADVGAIARGVDDKLGAVVDAAARSVKSASKVEDKIDQLPEAVANKLEERAGESGTRLRKPEGL